jgi:non-specific serine/threonine protein kinase
MPDRQALDSAIAEEGMPQPSLTVRLFGPPEFLINGERLPRLKTRKGLYILALLTLRYGRDVDRGWLSGTLWPENDEAAALAYLRQSLTDLRHALGQEASRLLSPSSRTLRLEIDDRGDRAAEIDFVAFERCIKRGDAASLEQAVALYRGPLLEGWAEDWIQAEREACQQSYLGALETLARQAIETEDTATAIRYLRLIVAVDPLRESACRSLMQALAATRDFAALTQVYRDLRTVLRREVNAEPDAETQALFTRLRADARRQAAERPHSPRQNASAGNDAPPAAKREEDRNVLLPRPLSEFIGRRHELETIQRVLTTSRLVTLTGIGGVGKTRLAIRVAEEVADGFPDGVRFVDLSPLADSEQVARTAAGALGVVEPPGRDLTETLCEHLRERHLLLILDNCEHMPDECARFAAALLRECPDVRILTTSRQRLGITGETVIGVPPLTLPDLKERTPEDKNAATELLEYESVRLFVDRAQRVQPNLPLNAPTLLSIAEICLRLDGIPLALELAAARMSALGPEQIAARLTDRFRLLSSRGALGDRTAPARQRTLQATLDWSYDLLPTEEQGLLRHLSVFAGGWTLEAAEAVCVGNGLEDWEILDALTGLANHSLVVVEPDSGQARYRLLETVREYAQERLREGGSVESLLLRARHRNYFLHFALEAVPHLGGPDQALWLDRLERDHDNIRAALDGCLEEGTADAVRTGLRLAGEIYRFWGQRGHVSEGRRRYAALLPHAPEPSPERGRALLSAGILATRQGDYASAREPLEEALAVYRQMGNREAQATPLNVLADIARTLGDYSESRRLLEEVLVLRRETGHRPGEAALLNSLGNLATLQEDFAEARTCYEKGWAICQEIGDRALEGSILNGLGILADAQHDLLSAQTWFEQALARNREIGDSGYIIVNLYNLARNADKRGDPTTTEKYYREAFLLIRELGESRSRLQFAYLLKGMAMNLYARSLPETAARLVGASDAQREAIGVQLDASEQTEYEHLLAALKDTLGQETVALLRAEGRALRPDQAIQIALQE